MKKLKIEYSHSTPIRGVNNYYDAVRVFCGDKDLGLIFLYGDSTELRAVFDKINKELCTCKFVEDVVLREGCPIHTEEPEPVLPKGKRHFSSIPGNS